jgi:hypothetical protein
MIIECLVVTDGFIDICINKTGAYGIALYIILPKLISEGLRYA